MDESIAIPPRLGVTGRLVKEFWDSGERTKCCDVPRRTNSAGYAARLRAAATRQGLKIGAKVRYGSEGAVVWLERQEAPDGSA